MADPDEDWHGCELSGDAEGNHKRQREIIEESGFGTHRCEIEAECRRGDQPSLHEYFAGRLGSPDVSPSSRGDLAAEQPVNDPCIDADDRQHKNGRPQNRKDSDASGAAALPTVIS